MGNLRCPVCTKLNKDDAIVCEFCGARLDPVTGKLRRVEGLSGPARPLGPKESGSGSSLGTPPLPEWPGRIAEGPSEEAQPGETHGMSEELPDWLGGLEDRVAAAGEVPEAAGPTGTPPDWFGRLAQRPAAAGETPGPERHVTDSGGSTREDSATAPEPEDVEPADELPAWLMRLRQKQAASQEQLATEQSAEGSGESALRRALFRELPLVPPDKESPDAYDWLENLRARKEQEDALPLAQPAAPVPEPTGREGGAREAPQWLAGLREASSGEAGPPPGQIPDWLEEFAQESGLEDLQTAGTPSWLQEIQPESSALEGGAKSTVPREGWLEELVHEGAEAPGATPGGAVPSWMEELTQLEEDFAGPTAGDLEPHAIEPIRQPTAEAKPGDRPTLPYETEAKPRDSWIEELAKTPTSAHELPRVPALVTGNGAGEAAPPAERLDLDAIQLPDWLGELQALGPPVEAVPAEGASRLAPATLPAWLEAMRPMETFRPVTEVQAEEDTAVESAGPLAGLRGVLLAEPVVAMPRSGALTGSRLDITERQYAQAELLRRMVEEEQRELPAARPAARRPPFLRWLVGIFLVSMVALPLFWEGPVFPQPGPDSEGRVRLPIELAPLAEFVNTLPAEKPVLMAFEYDAGYAGELEPVAGALLEHVVLRGIRVVTVSTQQTGPLLAERLIQRIGSAREYTVGRDYLHLGYLAGGPTAVQLLASNPRLVGQAGFYPRGEGYSGGSVWESPVLQGVQRLSDFGIVIVVASGSQQARMWAEQVGPQIGDVPLAMVLSAGVEPMIRPYFESPQHQVDAILSGLPSAVKYEQLIQIPAIAAARWDTFGAGMMAVEIILIAGAAYGVILSLLRPRGA